MTIVGRPSLFVHWESPVGTVHGEATPLRGYGRDDFSWARRDLSSIRGEQLTDCVNDICQRFGRWSAGAPADVILAVEEAMAGTQSPSARFCLEMLVLAAASRRLAVPIWRLLSGRPVASRLPTSAVVDPLSTRWREMWHGSTDRGIEHFKIKCGRDDTTELRVIEEMCQSAPSVRLRLDANGAWSLERASRFIKQLPQERIDWVEDPTDDPSEWALLKRASSVRLGVDEPLVFEDVETGSETLVADVIVLKPMALGGFCRCVQWAARAKETDKLVAVSHLFDGPVAMSACIHLAFAVQSPEVAPGLGRHAALGSYGARVPAPENLSDSWLTCPTEGG